MPRYGRTNTTTRWFTRASGRRALGAMCVARLPHRRTSGRLLRIAAAENRSWHGWMEAAILLLPMPRAEAELTRRVMGMGLNDLITEKAGRCLGVSELTASLVQRRGHGALRARVWSGDSVISAREGGAFITRTSHNVSDQTQLYALLDLTSQTCRRERCPCLGLRGRARAPTPSPSHVPACRSHRATC